MDAFFASVEQKINPELKNSAVVVTSNLNSPTIIAASYSAKALGYKVGNRFESNNDVYRLAANHRHYLQESKNMVQALRASISPNIEIYSIDEVFIDLTDQKRLYASTEAITDAINQCMQHLDLPVKLTKFL